MIINQGSSISGRSRAPLTSFAHPARSLLGCVIQVINCDFIWNQRRSSVVSDVGASVPGLSVGHVFSMFEAAERARDGDVAYFRSLTPQELSSLIVGRDEDGRTLFHTAAANGHLELLELLAGSGATKVADKQDDEGWTPLHSAVSSGREKVVAALMELGVNPDTTNSGGQTALHYAASKGYVGIMRLLIKSGAKVNAKDKTGSSPLHRAASAGKYDTARVLVEEGKAKLDSHDKTGATPLFVAVSCKEANIAVYLASKGADLENATKDGETPLSIAGDLAAALNEAKASGRLTNGAMEH